MASNSVGKKRSSGGQITQQTVTVVPRYGTWFPLSADPDLWQKPPEELMPLLGQRWILPWFEWQCSTKNPFTENSLEWHMHKSLLHHKGLADGCPTAEEEDRVAQKALANRERFRKPRFLPSYDPPKLEYTPIPEDFLSKKQGQYPPEPGYFVSRCKNQVEVLSVYDITDRNIFPPDTLEFHLFESLNHWHGLSENAEWAKRWQKEQEEERVNEERRRKRQKKAKKTEGGEKKETE